MDHPQGTTPPPFGPPPDWPPPPPRRGPRGEHHGPERHEHEHGPGRPSTEARAYYRAMARWWTHQEGPPPHWDGPGPPPGWRGWKRSGPRRLWLWFMSLFGLIGLFIVGGLAAAAMLIYWIRYAGPPAATGIVLSCGLALALPGLATALGILSFRGIARPLGEIMEAADSVTAGDLSVQVRERGPGPFRRLAATFNRMTRELARSEQVRRNLTADVAHELRNPLHILQGNIEGVIDGVYAPTTEHMQATLEEVRILARLVEDLRLLSQAESGGLSLNLDAVPVGELLDAVTVRFGGQAEQAGIRLLCESVQGGDLLVRADPDRLEQVLSNLMSNALRHTPPGASIRLSAEAGEEGVLIRVADTGEGIPAEDLPYIFDRFWRGDRSRTRSEGSGSGLGLAISRQLIAAQGGTIEVESRLGQGTVFTIWLPGGEPEPTRATEGRPDGRSAG